MIAHPTTPLRTRARQVPLLFVSVGVAWVAVALVHPTSLTDDDIRMWMIVHIAQLAFAPVIALGLLQLMRGIGGGSAAIARGAAVLWAAWFSAYDAVAGIATGILTGGDAGSAGEYLFEHGLITGLGWLAPSLWLVAAIPAGVASRASGAPRVTSVGLFVSSLIFTHAGPPAAVGFAALTAALWTGLRIGDRPEAASVLT